MFDPDEFQQLIESYQRCAETAKEYRRIENATLSETPLDIIYQPFYSKYKELAGVEAEFIAEEIISRHALNRWKDHQHQANVG